METTASHPSPDPPEKNPGGDQTGTATPGGSISRQILLLPDGSMPVPLGSGTITSVLGEGGAAIVYEIWVEKLGIARAVKVLKPNASIESTGRFESEMRITAQLRHPNIIEIHNVGEWHGLPYIEMEKIDGSALDTVIHERGSLPLKVCTSIGIIVCRALNFTHNHTYLINEKKHVGILHRDLKPGNIMISKNGMVKLMDFGIATPTGVSLHTMEGTVVGSMQYIAPELLEGAKHASARSDIFSFGCVLYEMITGQRTFSEPNMARLVAARMKNDYRPLSEFKVKCPRQLVKLINACLTLNPDKRIKSVAEILVRLEKIHAKLSKNKPEDLVEYYISSTLEKSTVSFKRKSRFKTFAAACCAVAAAAGACYYIFVMRPDTLQNTTIAPQDRPVTAAPRTAVAPHAPAPAAVHRPALPTVQEFGFSLPTKKAQGADGGHAQAGEIKSGQVADMLSPGSQNKPLISSLESKYGTRDLLKILAEETAKGNFGTALKVFEALDRESAATVSARLYKLRAVQGLGNKEALDAFFLRPDVPDKEYFLAKAQHLASLKRYAEAADLCDKSRQAQASIGDAQALDLTSSYVKASCLTNNFMVLATEDARKQALESWFEVKYLLRSNQGHPYFELSNKNIRLLSDQSKKTGL
jgi:serine/threonine protein kinase